MQAFKKRRVLLLSPLLSLVFLLFLQKWAPEKILSERNLKRMTDQTLFLALDAIPYSMVEKIYEEKKLNNYQRPSRLISVFPSTTTACFTGIFKPLGGGKGPGYDAKFFSYAERKVRGNLLEAYDVGGAGYKKFFSQMRSSGFEQTVMYSAPNFALRVDLARLKPAIWNSPEKRGIYFYIGSSDATAHLDGREATENLFLEALLKVEEIRKEYRRDFNRDLKVVLFSDHGFHWDQMKPFDVDKLGESLKNRGFLLKEDLNRPNHVAAITWGNISGGDLYSARENIPGIVSSLMEFPGVDLIMYREGDGILVEANREKKEQGKILFDEEGKSFSYQTILGDPLNYLPVVSKMTSEGKIDSMGFAREADWFANTKNHHYPDALYRIWDAFFGLAQNPATLLLSTHENYEFGSNWIRYGSLLRGGLLGTHGSLASNSSSGFLMTSGIDVSIPEVVRYDEALTYFQ